MFKALLKKHNGNKGFTLIELIVVIAILAILALLLVPRFAGFTDNAKESADKASMETIEKATLTLISTDKIRNDSTTDIVILIANSTASTAGAITISASGSSNAGTSGANVQDDFRGLLGTQYKTQKTSATGFQVNVTPTEDVIVDTTP